MEILKSLVAGEAFSPLVKDTSAWLDAIERALDTGFYSRIETCNINEAAHRARTRRMMEAHGAALTYWTIPAMTAEGLCLSSMDKSMRDRTVKRISDMIGEAVECGAEYIGIPSGSDPGAAHREDATKHLIDSICQLNDVMARYPNTALLIEPLDREVHKRQLIGPIEEAVALCQKVRAEGVPFYICWDGAHEALGGANLERSFATAAPYMAQFHLCNAVLNPQSPLYGDYHMPVSLKRDAADESYLTMEVAAQILRQAQALNGASGRQLSVALEIRTKDGGDGAQTEALIREFLTRAFDLAASKEA